MRISVIGVDVDANADEFCSRRACDQTSTVTVRPKREVKEVRFAISFVEDGVAEIGSIGAPEGRGRYSKHSMLGKEHFGLKWESNVLTSPATKEEDGEDEGGRVMWSPAE